jgi:hypothetical protein
MRGSACSNKPTNWLDISGRFVKKHANDMAFIPPLTEDIPGGRKKGEKIRRIGEK